VGASCTINVTFKPVHAGLQQAIITVTPTPGGPVTIPLTGTGLAATLQASPPSLSFGAVLIGDARDMTLTFTNVGSAPLTISAMSLGGPASLDYSFSIITPLTLSPGGSATLDLGFAPSRTGGRPATLTVTHDASNSPLVVTLFGSGLPPRPSGGGGGGGVGPHPQLLRERLQ